MLTKTVGTTPGVRGHQQLPRSTPAPRWYYCYTATNTGTTTLSTHDLVDDQLGTIFSGLNPAWRPGASINTVALGINAAAVINNTTTNTATWTSGSLSGSASATVTVPTYHIAASVNDPAAGSVVAALRACRVPAAPARPRPTQAMCSPAGRAIARAATRSAR